MLAFAAKMDRERQEQLALAERMIRDIRSAEVCEMLSIDPTVGRPSAADPSMDAIDGFPVLGRLPLSNTAQRESILSSLDDAVAAHDGSAAGCRFEPRHGIHFVTAGQAFDLLICFHCEFMRLSQVGQKPRTIKLTREPQPLFNEMLSEAGIPLAEKA